MQVTPSQLQEALSTLQSSLQVPFWKGFEFWISTVLGLAGLLFSILAFKEAKKAKQAATDAGRTVKVQTTTIDLTEIAQKLDRIQPEIRFTEARDLLGETSRRVRRITSPFAKDRALSANIAALLEAIQAAKQSLKSARPSDPSKESDLPHSIYFAIEGDVSTISDCVADLLGLFEKETLDFGDGDEDGDA